MDNSAVLSKVVTWVLAPSGLMALLRCGWSWLQRRRAAVSESGRRALSNATKLEAYADGAWDIIVTNDYGQSAGAGARSGYQYEFALPALADFTSTGDGGRDVCFEVRWRDLQKMVGDVNHHVDETYYSDFGGAEEALAVLERRAYHVADRALALARRYRHDFGLPHRQLGKRERLREQRIHDEAIAGDGRPFMLNAPALLRYWLAVRRCAPAKSRQTIYRSPWSMLTRTLRGILTAGKLKR